MIFTAWSGSRPRRAPASQVVKLAVKDLLDRRGPPRILMPRSKKGRGQKQMSHTALPITPALAAELRLAAADRPPREPLLLHAGEPWKAARHLQLFARTVKARRARLDHHQLFAETFLDLPAAT